jgi:hypothetical protein
MTVEVETPQGVRTGSSVMEVTASKQLQVTSETRPLVSGLHGEAVIVDARSGPVFVLLEPKNKRDLSTLQEAATFALAPDLTPGGWKPFWQAVNRLAGWFAREKANCRAQTGQSWCGSRTSTIHGALSKLIRAQRA